MQTLAKTLHSWRGEIAAVWRFTKNNAITEGFHRKMNYQAITKQDMW